MTLTDQAEAPYHYRGSLSKIASMIPGLPAGLLDGNEEEASDKLKKIVYITDAMTARELDSDGSCFVRPCPCVGEARYGLTLDTTRSRFDEGRTASRSA